MRYALRALFFVILFVPFAAAEHWDVGLAQNGSRIEATGIAGATAMSPTVLLIGGFNGNDESAGIVSQEVRVFENVRLDRRQFRLLAISVANPDRIRLQFPPAGVAYRDNSESHALWRWIGIHAPDIVLIAGSE